MRRRVRLLLAPLATGLALAGLLPPAAGDPGVRTGLLTALSYNVAGLPELLSGSEPTTNSPLISPLLNHYDLVLLQEDWADPLADDREAGLVPDEVPRLGFHDLVVADADHPYRSDPAPNPYGTDPRRLPAGPALNSDGLNRLSRFPFGPLERVMWDDCHGEVTVTAVEEAMGVTGLDDAFDDLGLGAVNHELDGGSADCGAQKGFSVARTELAPGITVDVYNLHADAGSHERDQAARRSNFAQLAAHILEHSAGHAVILGGDTNLKTDRPDRVSDAVAWSELLTVTGLIDVCQAVDCGADDAEIDKFAFRSAPGLNIVPQSHSFERERFTRADGEPLSDHDALAVTFRWIAPGRR
jgi:hypothetical protein